MDFEAETWDVSEEANQLSKLLFTAAPVSFQNVKKKRKKKSKDRDKQESQSSEQLHIGGSSNNNNEHKSDQTSHITGKNKVGKSVEKLTSNVSLDNDVDFTVLNEKTVNKKNSHRSNKSDLQHNNDFMNDQGKKKTCDFKERDLIKVNKKKSKLEKFEYEAEKNISSKNVIDLEDSTMLGKQPKIKKRKIINEKIIMPEEKSSSNFNAERNFETVEKDSQVSNNQKRKSTLDGEKDGYESHSKKKTKQTHSSESVKTEMKNSKQTKYDQTKINSDMEIQSPAKKKKKDKKRVTDMSPKTNGGIIQTGIDLNNDCASTKSEMPCQRKLESVKPTEHQMGDNLMQGSHENNKTKKKRRRKKKDKSLKGAGMPDTELSSANNHQSSISNQDRVLMDDNDVSFEDEPTLKTSEDSKVKQEDRCLKGNKDSKKLVMNYCDGSLNADISGAKVTGDKRDNQSKNIREIDGSKNTKSQNRNSLPFTPLKIKELLAAETNKSLDNRNNSRGNQKNVENTPKQYRNNFNFNRSNHVQGESPNPPKKKAVGNDSAMKPKSLLEQNRAKLEAARFRFINEQLYTRTGAEALDLFKDDPEAFDVYHKGFQNQVDKWPVNPVDVIIDFVLSLPSRKVIADFGCGDAKLAQSVPNKVHSFDLVAMNKHVTVCDISNVPLPDHSVDIAVFCLSLMGTNFSSYLSEANRVLKKGATLIIAEVASRFHKLTDFLVDLKRLGFKSIEQDTKNQMFVLMKFEKKSSLKKTVIKQMKLKPCVYKKR